MKRFYPIHTILLAITALALGVPARAAVPYCADSAGEIVSDIGNANGGAEGTTQEIRIVRGTYNITQTLEFKPAGEKDNKNFTLSGGWSAGCADGTQIVDPDKTILNFTAAASDSRKVNLEGDNASYRVEGIRFVGFSEFRIEDHDCSLFDSCPDTETISLRYNEFRNGNHVTPVKDQGNCGSCVSFCSCGLVESMSSIEQHQLLDLSEADLHFCSSHGPSCGDGGPIRRSIRSRRAVYRTTRAFLTRPRVFQIRLARPAPIATSAP